MTREQPAIIIYLHLHAISPTQAGKDNVSWLLSRGVGQIQFGHVAHTNFKIFICYAVMLFNLFVQTLGRELWGFSRALLEFSLDVYIKW